MNFLQTADFCLLLKHLRAVRKIKPIYLVLLGILLLVLGANFLIPDPELTPTKRIEKKKAEGKLYGAWDMYTTAVINDPFNMDLHYGFIILFDRLSDDEVEKEKREEHIYNHYRTLSHSEFRDEQDVGNYGLGLLASISGEYTTALEFFDDAHERELKYLNNSIGRCLLETGEVEEAKSYFFREIEIDGNTDGAFLNLAEIYRDTDDKEALVQLWENEKSRTVINPQEIRDIHRERGNVIGYLKGLLAEVFRNLNFLGFLGAFLILAVWFFYLRKIDIYQKDSFLPAIYTVLLGMVFTLGVFVISDFIGTPTASESRMTISSTRPYRRWALPLWRI